MPTSDVASCFFVVFMFVFFFGGGEGGCPANVTHALCLKNCVFYRQENVAGIINLNSSFKGFYEVFLIVICARCTMTLEER